MKNKIKIAPSILSADFANLEKEIKAIEEAGADYIHIDVMDGHFVPNLTIGPCVIKALRKTTKLPFDVHLMIDKVDQYIEDYAQAGADIITFHIEASTHIDRTISLIKSYNKKVGISLVPSTHESVLDYIISELDLILIMTVNPGFGGQKFIPSQLEKIKKIKQKIKNTGKDIELQVDGGITSDNIEQVVEAGANVIVAGSYIFKDGPEQYKRNINSLRP